MKNWIMNTIRLDVTLFRSLTLLLTTLLVVAFPVAAQTPAAPDNLGPTLSKVARSGTLFAAHRESAVPFSFLGDKAEEGTVYGYSWEICQHVAKAVNERLGREVRVVPVTVSANSRIMMVKVGMADLECGATTNSVARLKQAAFSNTIYVAGVRVMVRKDSGVKRIADLADKRVVTTLGTTADRLVKLAALANNITIQFVIGRNHRSQWRCWSGVRRMPLSAMTRSLPRRVHCPRRAISMYFWTRCCQPSHTASCCLWMIRNSRNWSMT